MKNESEKKSGKWRGVLAVAATLIIIVLAVLAIVFRDKLSAESIRGFFGVQNSYSEGEEAYTYESGSGQVFALMGERLLIASSTGAQLLDADGRTVSRLVFPMSSPAIAASKSLAAVFDVGGTTLRILDISGEMQSMDSEGRIISVTMNENGCMALVTETAGYKAKLTVFNSSLEAIYEWYSGTGYVLSAHVAPNDRDIAVLTATEEGGRVVFLSADSAEERGDFLSYDELFFDAKYMDSDTLCILSERRAVFLDSAGEPLGVYDFGGDYLADYDSAGSEFMTFRLCRYRTGNEGRLVTVGADAQELGSINISEEIVSISGSGNRVAVLLGGSAVIYDRTLEEKGSAECPSGTKRLLLSGSRALLLSTYSAQIVDF